MTLRTPRRRISPRTKRRYRAIREFFRRALGSSSQPDIKISSSIALNVTDLKRKIVGLEQQLDEVNKHCQDIAGLDCSRKESESYVQSEAKHEIDTIKEQTEASSEKNINGIQTKLIYKSSGCGYRKSEDSDFLPKAHDAIDDNEVNGMNDQFEGHVSKVKNKKSKLHKITDYGAKLHKYRARSVYDNLATVYSTSSFHSLANPRKHHRSNADYAVHPSDGKYFKQDYVEPLTSYPHKERKYKEHVKRNKMDYYKETYEQKPNKIRKHKHHSRELDQDFIADIIRRQYKPVKMFGRKESDLSQISAPVCRDQEFPICEDIQEGPELCSCCYDENNHKVRRSDLSDMRSICDTRLYSSKKYPRTKHRRKQVEIFNNSDLYDLIPVKEKSSPKTRRKFTENMIPYQYYKEVPPSPRTLRPRLNLKAQYNTDFEDYMAHVKHSRRKNSPRRQRRHHERVDLESDMTSEVVPNFIIEQPRKTHKHTKCQAEKQELCQQDTGTFSSLQYSPYMNEQANATIDTTFNKTQETEVNVDKTDKALCEIKDILQNFLHEIKKETTASQCDKSDVSSKTGDNGINTLNDNSTKLNGNTLPSRHSFNNYSVGQCTASPYIPSFTNPCCYPVMPMCPMNCPISMPNGYMMPSQSYTCTNCANTTKESTHADRCCNKNMNTTGTCHTETCHTETCHKETEELIKEIYKFVAQSPVRKKEYENSSDRREAKRDDGKMLTSRSVGESSKLSRHDAKVGTAPLKCYSKSCEAIRSRENTNPYSSGTNASYSDTILEKLSLEVTQTTSETEVETETTEEKVKPNKFSKVLRSMGLFKKKKKDVIEELSESESTIDVEIKTKPPYRQEITNYMMHGQEYFHPPPVPPNYQRPTEYQRPHEYQPDYHPPYNPGVAEYPPSQPIHEIFSPRAHHSRMRDHATAPPFNPKHRPTAPPYHSTYENHYNQMQQPQVPLCLKEIEVKSIGTQSERKMSIFRKIKKKIQPPLPQGGDYEYNPKNCSTQTQTAQVKAPTKPLFNWKNLQAKAMQDANKLDPMKFSLKAQRELAEGDQKLRNAMLKKLFYKRNPFSPRNLIVRTLLGKDKSSFGETPNVYRPRMFF